MTKRLAKSPAATPSLELFVGRLQRRSILSEAEIEALRSLPFNEAHFRSNQDVVRLGELVNHACFICKGLVGRFGQIANGERQIIALHIPGDMADLHSVVGPRVMTPLQALTATTILQVPHDALRQIATDYPALAHAFWRDCMVDMAAISQWMLSIGRRNAKQRLAHLICEMACRYQLIDAHLPDDSFILAATQHHIGDALGLTPVHVNRMFRALKEERLLEVDGRTIRILDRKGLVELAEFDPVYLQLERFDLHAPG